MKNTCRFKECGQYGQMNAIIVNARAGEFELTWCTKCGRIQNKFQATLIQRPDLNVLSSKGGEMNKMSNNDTIDPATIPKLEFPDAVNLNKIAGEEIFITGYTVNRGTPNDYTKPEDIGEDGKTEYRTIQTEASFKLKHKGEEKQINHFYVPIAVGKQVGRFEEEITRLDASCR